MFNPKMGCEESPMKVYIVLRENGFEVTEIVAVFASLESAEGYIKENPECWIDDEQGAEVKMGN
jgi:hypothetical protein